MLFQIRSLARNRSFPAWSIPIALLALTLLSYGLRALSLGFYWDDWPYLWIFQRAGPTGIATAFSSDRPFLSFIYTLSLSAFGNSSQAWQVFGLLARWLCTLAFWWMLSRAWPRHTQQVAWAAFLFAVYPGFTQQWIVVIYGQDFILYAAVFVSVGITLWLARQRARTSRATKIALTLLALALSAFCMFSTEYFFGLELLRPVLLWVVLNEGCAASQPAEGRLQHVRRQFLQAASWWAPYLALMIIFVIWRGFLHTFPGHDLSAVQGIQQNPLSSLWGLALTITEDLIEASLVAWGQTMQSLSMFIENDRESGLRTLTVILSTALLASLYLAKLCAPPTNTLESEPTGQGFGGWGKQAVYIGLFAMLMAGWPFWITGLPMRMGFPQDRYALALAPGVCLLFTGLIDWISRPGLRQARSLGPALLIGILVGLAAGFHFSVSQSYRQDWNDMRSMFWQLTWRAPQIRPNTFLMTDRLSLRYYEDDSLSAPLNWTYDPDGKPGVMKYFLFDLGVRRAALYDLRPGSPITKDFRSNLFQGNASQALSFSYAAPGCVRVLDPLYDAEQYNLPDRLQQTLAVSNPSAVILDQQPAAVPPLVMGSEPKHRWCYYFEKAELARQNGEWDTIRNLFKEARKLGFSNMAADESEFLPFIEGFARSTDWNEALSLSESSYQNAPEIRPALCSIYRRAMQDLPRAKQPVNVINRVNSLLNCQLP